MPRADSGSQISVALGELRSQTTNGEFQRAVSFLVDKATELRNARGGVLDPTMFRLQCSSPSFRAAIGRYAAAAPCLGALGFELSDACEEFLLPGQLEEGAADTLATVISELLSSVPGSGADGSSFEGERTSVIGALRRSFGGGAAARNDGPQTALLDGSTGEAAEQLSRTSSAGAAFARGFSGMRTTFGRTFSGGAAGIVKEFNCPICMCNESVTESFTLACGHRFCRECVAGYVTSKVNDAQLQMTCPDLTSSAPVSSSHTAAPRDAEHGGADPGLEAQVGCPFAVDTTIIRMLLDAPTRAKHDRFVAMSSNPMLRECPADGCTALVQPTVNWRGVIKPDMTCDAPGCGQTFCYFHSAAHPGRTCRQYLSRSMVALAYQRLCIE